ncbi:uncharacterized protein V1518DRAFT_406747 [Limtongia smithiae]|uniref:uncharacterized protein n=1 Tax=Limtongia smithiae TaxID=1125753 RepID=UPI0034D0007A
MSEQPQHSSLEDSVMPRLLEQLEQESPSWDSIPQEIHEKIFEYLLESDRRALLGVASVSRRFNQSVSSAIYRNITVRTLNELSNLDDRLGVFPDMGPRLTDGFRLDLQGSVTDDKAGIAKHLTSVLSVCKNLRTLTINVREVEDSDFLMNFLSHNLHLPIEAPLQKLEILCSQISKTLTLASQFPNLNTLCIAGYHKNHLGVSVSDMFVRLPTVRNLQLVHIEMSNNDIGRFCYCLNNLEYLQLEYFERDPALLVLEIQKKCRSFRKISLKNCKLTFHQLIHLFLDLESVELIDCYQLCNLLSSIDSKLLLASLPRLRNLRIEAMLFPSAAELLEPILLNSALLPFIVGQQNNGETEFEQIKQRIPRTDVTIEVSLNLHLYFEGCTSRVQKLLTTEKMSDGIVKFVSISEEDKKFLHRVVKRNPCSVYTREELDSDPDEEPEEFFNEEQPDDDYYNYYADI